MGGPTKMLIPIPYLSSSLPNNSPIFSNSTPKQLLSTARSKICALDCLHPTFLNAFHIFTLILSPPTMILLFSSTPTPPPNRRYVISSGVAMLLFKISHSFDYELSSSAHFVFLELDLSLLCVYEGGYKAQGV